MFFSFSLFPPGISARCSRSAFPPGVSARISARISARHFPPAVLGSRSVSALRLPLGACPFLPAFLPCGPSPRFRPAFPPGVWVCATACYSRSAFPPGISLRRGLVRGAFPRSVCLWGLVRFCLPVFCMRLLPHTAKNAPAGIRTLACSAAAPAAGTVLSNRPAAPSAAESAPYGLQSYI